MNSSRVSKLVRVSLRYAGWLALLPFPLWLLFHSAIQPRAAWRAHYVPENRSEPTVTRFEQALSHYWTGTKESVDLAPVNPKRLTAAFDTCISTEQPLDVPLMLVASGAARLSIDAQLVLEVGADEEHTTRGKHQTFTPGTHHIHVEFAGRTRPVIGLLASFDGTAPRPVASGSLIPGVKTFRPDSDSMSCKP